MITWMEAFLMDRKANGVARGTMVFYTQKLRGFEDFCEAQQVKQISQITPNILRQYLLNLEETNHNPGGRHAFYRVIRAFLLWYEKDKNLK
jgi:site-specific recombinase XerD